MPHEIPTIPVSGHYGLPDSLRNAERIELGVHNLEAQSKLTAFDSVH
jgi:hypothetical protein